MLKWRASKNAREDNLRRWREEQEKYKHEDELLNNNSSSQTPAWMNNGSQTGGETATMAASQQSESQELKVKRSEIARKVMPLASSQMLRDLLQDLCENADEQTLNIIMKHV